MVLSRESTTGTLSSSSQEVLQSFMVDLKDFTKARARYDKLREELSPNSNSTEDPELMAENAEKRRQLCNAWEEYLNTVQLHFRKMTLAVITELTNVEKDRLPAAQRAERLNELCTLGERWFLRNESLFELQEAEKAAMLTEVALNSSSCVMRLLGLQLARLYAADVTFSRQLFTSMGCGLIGLCFDRENGTEVEYALNVGARLIELHESDPKAYPDFPFGWMYRIASIIDVNNPVPNVQPKRKSQAIRIAIKLLRRFPGKATAASLHTILLRNCIHKGAVTMDEMQNILYTILDLFDRSETRQYIRYNDLDVLYAPLLSTTEKSTPENIALMNGAKDVLAMVMRSWIGVIWTSSETKGLRALIDVLHLPGDPDRKLILLTLFSKVLCQLAPHRGLTEMRQWGGAEEEKRRQSESQTLLHTETGSMAFGGSVSSPIRANFRASSDRSFNSYDVMLGENAEELEEFVPTTKAIGYHVMDPILGRTLLMLAHHGLPLALVTMVQGGSDRNVTLVASSLLQDLLVLMDTILPVSPVKRLHTALNRAIGQFAQEGDFFYGGGITSRLFRHQKISYVTDFVLPSGMEVSDSGKVVSSTLQATAAFGIGTLDIDNTAFQALLRESRVEQGKDSTEWNYDLILLLVQGPLRSLPRFLWTLQETRFFHRLVSFYQPALHALTRTFVSLRVEECTPQLCVLGLALLDLFLSTSEGTRTLDRFGFTSALAASLKEVIDGSPRVLNRQRLDSRVGQTLLRMAGRYSLFANGLMVMKEYQIFGVIASMFNHLTGERVTSPEKSDTLHDVCIQLLQCLCIGAVPNFGVCEEIRQIFRTALCNESDSIRLCATVQLRRALWRDLSTSMRWGIETLVQVLHDDYYKVVECAFKLLLSICLCSEEALDCLISLSPTVLMESDVIQEHAEKLHLNVLLYCIVGRPSGFRFLQCYGWVEQELRRWEETASAEHVTFVERIQSGRFTEVTFNSFEGRGGWPRHNRTFSDPLSALYRPAAMTAAIPILTTSAWQSAGFFPTHFAAVLCRSNEGCTLFKHSNLWQRSVHRLLEQPLPPDIVLDNGKEGGDSEDSDDAGMDLAPEDSPYWDRFGSQTPRTSSIEQSESRLIKALQDGRLPSSTSATLLSASRGYKPAGQSYILECVGTVAELKDALLCVCHAASSDTGYSLFRSVPGLAKRLVSLTRFASVVTVRGMGLVGECLVARSKRGAEHLQSMSYHVISESNAYTGANGVPYSVSFAHVKPSKWTSIGRRHTLHQRTSCPHFAHNQWLDDSELSTNSTSNPSNDPLADLKSTLGPARRVLDQVYALSNPVSREAAKKKLYQMMKMQPQFFLDPKIRRILVEVSQTYRVSHKERKFIADLLDNAPLSKIPPTKRRAIVVTPP